MNAHRHLAGKSFVTFTLLFALFSALCANANSGWQTLAPGMELRRIATSTPGPVGDSQIVVLRMDPDLWQLEFVGAGWQIFSVCADRLL